MMKNRLYRQYDGDNRDWTATKCMHFEYRCSAVAEMGDRLATIDMGRKVGVLCPLLRGAGSPSNTTWPGPRSTPVPSGILIHPAVWLDGSTPIHQRHRQTDRQDNGPVA